MNARIWIVTIALALAGCGSPYINIPPLAGDSPAWHNPNNVTVIDVESVAVKSLAMRDAPANGYGVELLAGTTEKTYAMVMSRLGEGATRTTNVKEGQPLYKVAQVQVRGLSAQVDVIRPADVSGKQELVSVYIQVDMDGWYAASQRVWRVPVDEAMALAHTPPQAPIDDKTIEDATAE